MGMVQTATEKIIQCDLVWMANALQCACWAGALDETHLEFTMYDVNCKIPGVQETVCDGIAAVKRGSHDVGHETLREPERCQQSGQKFTSTKNP